MKFARLDPRAKPLTKKNTSDAGFDICALNGYTVAPHAIHTIRTGITIEVPKRCYVQVHEKSRSDLVVIGGVIDHGFQGEVLVKVSNPNDYSVTIANGYPVAQLVIHRINIEGAEELPKSKIHQAPTARGKDGGINRQLLGDADA